MTHRNLNLQYDSSVKDHINILCKQYISFT